MCDIWTVRSWNSALSWTWAASSLPLLLTHEANNQKLEWELGLQFCLSIPHEETEKRHVRKQVSLYSQARAGWCPSRSEHVVSHLFFNFFFGASFWVFGFHSVRSALFWFSHACRWTQRSRARAGRYFWGSVRTLETNAPKGLGISVPRLSKTTRPHKSFQIRTSRLKRVWSHIFLHLLTWSALVFWFIFVSSP